MGYGHWAAAAALLGLAGCVTPEGPDTEPPTLTFAAGGRTFFSTAGGGSNTPCPGPLAAAYAVFPADADFVHVREGGASAALTLRVSDPSGVKRVFLQIPNGDLRAPEVTKTVPIPTPSGGSSQVFEYNFFGQEGAAATAHSVTIDLTHSDGNRIFNVFATDFADNQTPTTTVVVGEASNLCA